MSDPFFRPAAAGIAGVTSYDAGLRAHMQRVFNYMAGGLALTGVVAFFVVHSPLLSMFFAVTPAGQVHTTLIGMVAMLAPFVFVLYMQMRIQTISVARLQTMFWLYCAVMGLSLSLFFLVFSGADIARAFFITAADFGAMSLYGYTTRRDLTAMGGFMMMGLIGLIIASMVNFFLRSSEMQWVVSVVSVIVFTGLTAYRVQYLKQAYEQNAGDANNKLAIWGALSLYLSFINLFTAILNLSGGGRR